MSSDTFFTIGYIFREQHGKIRLLHWASSNDQRPAKKIIIDKMEFRNRLVLRAMFEQWSNLKNSTTLVSLPFITINLGVHVQNK